MEANLTTYLLPNNYISKILNEIDFTNILALVPEVEYVIFLISLLADIDECSASAGVCDVNANCKNTLGSHVCSCKAGFTGDGKTCTGEGMLSVVGGNVYVLHRTGNREYTHIRIIIFSFPFVSMEINGPKQTISETATLIKQKSVYNKQQIRLPLPYCISVLFVAVVYQTTTSNLFILLN